MGYNALKGLRYGAVQEKKGWQMSLLDSAVKIGKKSAPNRIVNQPMECNDADEMGNPTERTFDRYRKLAEGGAGIIFLEALTITQESRARKNQLGIYEKTAPRLE